MNIVNCLNTLDMDILFFGQLERHGVKKGITVF